MTKRFIDVEEIYNHIRGNFSIDKTKNADICFAFIDFMNWLDEQPTADVAEVEKVSEQIIRKKAEVTEYWKNDVKQYRALKGYSDIEHDTDNFLRGYNEAVEDMLAILDGARMDGDSDDL